MCQLATVAAELGDRDAGAILYTTLLPGSICSAPAARCLPIHVVSHCLGRLAARLGHVDAADEHFAEVWRTHRRMQAPLYTAETVFKLGSDVQGLRSERARHLLAHTLDLARRYGFTDVEQRAENTLASASTGRPPLSPPWSDEPGSL
jgi:hypothetical protein